MNSILKFRKSIIEARKKWDFILEKALANDTVIDKNDKVLNRDVVSDVIKEQQKQLGIYGGCVALLSNAEKMPMLLYAPKIQKMFKLLRDNSEDNIYDYEYLETPYDGISWIEKSKGENSNLNYFIDLLYFLSRKKSCPEYVNAIKYPNKSIYEYNFQYNLRLNYEVLHCSSGEIQFFILAWATIVFFAKNQGLKAEFNSLNFDKEYDGKVENWAELFKSLKDSVEGQLSKHFSELHLINETNYDTDFIAIKNAIEYAQAKITENTIKLINLHNIIEALQLNTPNHFNEFSKYYQYLFGEAITINCFKNQTETIIFMKKFMKNLKGLPNFKDITTIEDMVLKLHIEARFPIIPYYYMMVFDKNQELKEHLVFPIWFAFSNDTKYTYKVGENEIRESAVLHALYTIKPIWKIDNNLHHQNYLDNCSDNNEHWYTDDGDIETNESTCFENYLSQLIIFFNILTKPIIDKEYYSKVRRNDIVELEKQATRAAISQDQARAGSHNIGSHVLNRLISNLFNYRFNTCYQSNYNKEDVNRLFNIQELLDKLSSFENTESCNSKYNDIVRSTKKLLNLELFELTSDCSCHKIIKRANIEHIKNHHYQNLLNHQSKLNNYIKCRMDYLSDISFGIPAMQISKRFKNEVLTELDDVRLLLENISGLSDFKYSIEFKCAFDDDPAIAMPNDILGNQALFNLAENVLRNTAKHSDKSNIDDSILEKEEDKVVKFTIQINEVDMNNTPKKLNDEVELLYEVLIYDNIIVEGDEQKLTEEDKKDFKEKTKADAPDQMSKIDYLVFKQNTRLNESILKKEDNTLRSTSLGLIEMEASACYLRKMDVSNIENDEYQVEYDNKFYNQKNKINILKAVAIDNKFLGYRFFVLKPAEVLLIGDYYLSDNLKNNGFLCLTFDEFEKQIKNGKVFNHQFLIYENECTFEDVSNNFSVLNYKNTQKEESKALQIYKSLIPKRRLILKKEILDLFNNNSLDLLNRLWEEWGKINLSWSEKIIENSVCQDNPENCFIFLNHTKEQIKNNESEKKCFETYFLNDESLQYYIEPLSSLGQYKLPDFSKITKKTTDNNNLMLEYIEFLKDCKINETMYMLSLKESAGQEVVVLDERVQSAAYDKNKMVEDIMLYKYYQHTKLFIPSIAEINLSASDFYTQKDKLYAYLEKNISRDQIGKKRFLLIHYSLIERLYSNEVNKIKAINEWFEKYSQITNIIVTSGRGTPPDLPEYITYVNLSPVLAALLDFRSKFYLHQIIMSSRKTIRL